MKFTGENLLQFAERFSTDDACLQYLSEIKWSNGYQCKKCGHSSYSIRKANFSRECHRCHHIESPTANTIFHRLRFGIRKAFMIVFEMSATTKSLSASQVSKRYGISRVTAWSFMHKIRVSMKSSMLYPIEGDVQVDEFVIGGKEDNKPGRSKDSKKKKIVVAVGITDKGKISRVYFKKISDYSSASLATIFEQHISSSAKVYTDKWTGYVPLMNSYNIEQKYSDKGNGMKQLHTIVGQVKSWLRSVYSWVHEDHIEKYLDEYSFRINRSIYKDTIFHTLISRMMKTEHVSYQDIIVSS